MTISALEISNFRNLHRVALQCSPGFNLIIGGNASGKTSFLEALYFLARARSFRTRDVSELIQYGEKAFQIVATIRETGDGPCIPVGMQRSAQNLTARIDSTPVRSLAELAARLPVLLLNPDSHRLLEDGPKQRRRFMDWGLFYTDESFLHVWKRYNGALRNRNAALRGNSPDRAVDAWDQELVSASMALDAYRKAFCEALRSSLEPFLEQTLGKVPLQVDYRRGWPERENLDLMQLLRSGRDQDRRHGYTRLGAHRADFQIKLAERTVPDCLSRGQQKLLITALLLAQAQLYRRHRGKSCILLIDDLPAELDLVHRQRVIKCLAGMETQLFITAIEPDMLAVCAEQKSCRFTVCRGEISEMV